ncbi:potassium channel family protein [Opitutus sp. GAS368]|uniref:potassium channel family protein n=1 Tax=Opitutus sp. GAS368 TaxID=1882749 RepID=UPI00087ADB77|nr:potassium channel family protein [Opitutus sp. GAS368]SDR75655.1 voltage-gated potassium channel [Opitutus sp. GAS368]
MTLTLKEAARQNGRVIYLELMVLVLSLYALAALTAELLLPLDQEVRALLRRTDDFVCAVFLLDFCVHLALAPSKKVFWRLGWIDLLSSIPEIGWLRWGRLFRVFRILRALRSFAAVYNHFAADRAKGTFVIVGLMSVIAVLFATIAVFEFEHGVPGSNIHSAGDALWWAFATITTIGYGDHYPVTGGGRIVAVVLVVFGLSFFGTFTAYVASFFLEKTQLKEESEIHRLFSEVRKLREQLERLELAGAVRPREAPPAASPATHPSAGRNPG